MINQFRKFTPLNLIFLLPLTLLLYVGAFANLPSELQTYIFEPAILNLLRDGQPQLRLPALNVLVSALLTLLQASYLNSVVNRFNLIGKSTFLPALLYVVMASIFTPFLILSPSLICNFLLIGMIDKLLSLYHRNENKGVMFDLGIIIALGTLFYFPFILMLLMLWVGLMIFKPFNWREWISGLIGFMSIYFMLFVVYFWMGMTNEFYQIWSPLTRPSFTNIWSFDKNDLFALAIPTLILILFAIAIQRDYYKNTVQVRKSFQLLLALFLLALASFYLNPHQQIHHFLLCIPSASIFMAYYFNHAKRKWLYEGLFLLMVFGIVLFHWI